MKRSDGSRTMKAVGISAVLATIAAAAPAPDPPMKAVLDTLASLGAKPIETLSVEQARKQPSPADAVKALLQKQGKPTAPEAVGKVEDRTIPGPGAGIPARIYWPKGDGPFPLIVYYHGGGWVIANLDVYDSTPRALANAVGAVVVSSHYRQAPEHKFPSAHDDAWTAYEWAVTNAAGLKADRTRVAIAGESAGGNLAANVAITARDKKMPAVHQLLVYPIADTGMDTPSYRENADAKPLSKAGMAWFFAKYPRTPADLQDARLALVNVKDLKGLPPATVVLAEIDPLRSEGEMYAEKLRAAGVDVAVQKYAGVTHEFFGMGAVHPKAKQAVAAAAERLRGSLGAMKK